MTAERLEADRAAVHGGAGELARRFIDGLNARDREAVSAIVTDDVEFRNPFGGEELSGEAGVRALVAAVDDAGLQLVPEGDERVDGRRVEVAVRVTLGSGDELRGVAVFEVRDGMVAAFEVVSELVDR